MYYMLQAIPLESELTIIFTRFLRKDHIQSKHLITDIDDRQGVYRGQKAANEYYPTRLQKKSSWTLHKRVPPELANLNL